MSNLLLEMASELHNHAAQLNLFLATWSAKQDKLLGKLTHEKPLGHPEDDTQACHEFTPLQCDQMPEASSGNLGFDCDQMDLDGGQSSEYEPEHKVRPEIQSSSSSADMDVCEHQSNNPRKKRQFQDLADIRVHHVVQHSMFVNLSGAVIIFNAAIIAASADYAMKNPDAPHSRLLQRGELACAIYYVLEIMLLFYTQRSYFYRGPDWRWNMFDVGLAVQVVIEQVDRLVINGLGAIDNLSFVRTLRLVKTLKLLRIVRLVRVFRELRLILSSLLGCMKTFTWAVLLSVTTCFIFAICIMQSCAAYMFEKNNDTDAPGLSGITLYWSSVTTSMISLWMASTGGLDWEAIASPLKDVGIFTYVIFLAYLAIFNFVILNVVNSIFLETMMGHAERDHQLIIQSMMEQKQDYIDKLQIVYDAMDDDNDGEVTLDEFCRNAASPALQAFVASLEIDMSDAKYFFRVLSNNGKNPVDIHAFVDGCIKMQGKAKSADLLHLLFHHRASVFEHGAFLQHIKEEIGILRGIKEEIGSLTEHVLAKLFEQTRLLPENTDLFQPQASASMKSLVAASKSRPPGWTALSL